MNVLLTVNAAWNVRNFRWPVVRALQERGDTVTVLAPPDDSVPAMVAEGVRFVPLAMRQEALGPLDNLKVLAQLHRRFGELRPDVVLSYTIKNNLFGALAARARGIPFIPNVSGLGTAFLSGGGLRLVSEALYRAAFARLPVVFFQNPDDRALFVARKLVAAQAARLLPGSGIDPVRFAVAPLPPLPPTFLMIARLLRDKGVGEYLEAARIVRRTHPEARFRLLGGRADDHRSALDPMLLEGAVARGDIEYLGSTDDVRPHVAAAHFVVLPSYREGAPRTLIEGAAMARPLIASDVPGCREIVDAPQTGLLCEARSAESLAGAVRAALALPPDEWVRMGLLGRDKMLREYDEKLVIDAYLTAIGRVTGRFGGPGAGAA